VQVAVLPGVLAVFCAVWLGLSWRLPHRAEHWWDLLAGSIAWAGGTLGMQVAATILPARASTTPELVVAAVSLNAVIWDRRRERDAQA